MSLRRSTTRSKSRSPAPLSTGFHEDRYLPPSHYAAAGGFVRKPPKREIAGDSRDYMPVSYLSHSINSSESSFEFKPADDPRFQTQIPGGTQRQSRIQNLPQLETLLLPSLRDTIDKMTRPPSRTASTTLHPHLEIPSTPSMSSRSPSPLDPYPAPPTPKIPTSTATTPKAKPALKSALRAPTPKVSIPKLSPMQALNAGVHSLSRNGSLKSMKNLMSGGRSKTPTPPDAIIDDKAVEQKGRVRSRTDPGKDLTAEPRRARFAMTPEIASNPAIPSETFVSALPRRTRFGAISTVPFDSRSSDSDLEARYERDSREKRHLVVANAHVVASSSSDSSDMEAVRTPDRQTRLPVLAARSRQSNIIPSASLTPRSAWARGRNAPDLPSRTRDAKPAIGLGLGMPKTRTGYNHEPTTRIQSYFEDELAPNASYDLHANDRNRTEEEDDDSSVYDEEVEAHGAWNAQQAEETARRQRREALMGIVNGLSSLELPSPAGDGLADESDYCGQEGLAVSGSGELASDDHQAARREPRRDEEPKGNQPSRIPSRNFNTKDTSMPTFVVSMDETRYNEDPRHTQAFTESKRQNETDRLEKASRRQTQMTKTKSPSRSLIIRQNQGVPLSARRHSVYHDSHFAVPAEPMPTPPRRQREPSGPIDERRSPSPHEYDSEASSVVESMYACDGGRAAAHDDARERGVFGIPPSKSVLASGNLTHADSDLSSVGSIFEAEDPDGLSMGAEALFNQFREEDEPETFSVASSSSSIYEPEEAVVEERLEQEPPVEYASSANSWRDELDADTYESLLAQHGPTEIQRQEVIWEIIRSEEEFFARLDSTLRLFITPLRVQDSKSWIDGVPCQVARLFDWLDDIFNLHSQVITALRAARQGQYPMVERLAESLREFVPKLEVYQPYLVRVEDVAGTIGKLVEEGNSDFGEFVRLQEASSEAGSLEDFLEEPVSRLTRYLEMFRRLLQFTPALHPDHLPTFALLHSTDMVIRVMSEVKTREDEYDLVKDVSARIQGLPLVHLARRERRLLAQGPVSYLPLVFNTQESLSVPSDRRGGSHLVDAIHDWGCRRSNSVKSTASSALSFRSHDKDRGKATSNSPPASSTVHMFVFTDIVVLAAPLEQFEDEDQRWRLLDEFGISRVIGIQNQPEVPGWTLNLLPTHDLDVGVIPDNAPLAVVNLSLPTEGLSPNNELQKNWTTAFQQCYAFTLRSLSFPSHSGRYLVHGPNVDLQADTRETVLSLLGSGLPIPKSPSIQIEESASDHATDEKQKEREERGWWSLRFQQVLKEMQRQDPMVSVG